VPGTLIEAFGDNGSYYAVESTQNGTARHPFQLDVPAGVGFHLVMVTGKDTPDEVITPIGFRDSTGRVRTRLMLHQGERIDLGHVPLYMGRNAASADDRDNDGVLDRPFILDDVGGNNPLSQADADDDGIADWDDPDHGGYQYDDRHTDPQDQDDDGIPNSYDGDYQARSDDSDGDGLPDSVDANRFNQRDDANDDLVDDCNHDGYSDADRDHDGFYDDDADRDGHHDSVGSTGEDDHSGCNGAPAGEQPAPTQPAPTQPAPTQPTSPAALDGQALYTSFCADCHGPSGKRGRSASAIASAIARDAGGMGSLSSLSADQVAAIADYLAR
jgi:mono/diheme cytochrome c family protein